MIITNDAIKQMHQEAEDRCSVRFGVKHLSPSSIRDAVECSQKMVFRSRYKSYGLAMECGTAIHEIMRLVQAKINETLAGTGSANFAEIRDAVIENVNFRESFVEIAMKNYATAQASILPVLYKENEQPICTDPVRLRNFFTSVAKYLTADTLRQAITEPAKFLEIDGYIEYPVVLGEETHYVVLFGRQDQIIISGDQKTWTVKDTKTTWSSRSNPLADDGTKFQLWVYKKMIEDHFIKSGLPMEGVKFEAGVKWIRSTFPKNLDEIEKKGLTFTVQDALIKITSTDEYRFDQRVRTILLGMLHGCGIIANSKYGCNYCSYATICEYRTQEEEA